jgi:hypothetical protein
MLDDHPDAARQLQVLGQEGHAHKAGYRSPVPHPSPLRVAFTGAAGTYAPHALHRRAGGLEPYFLDVRPGAAPRGIRAALEAAAPHVVIAFAPDAAVSEAVADLGAAKLAIAGGAPGLPGSSPGGAAGAFHRVLALPGTDLVSSSPGGTLWRARPLPVSDHLFAPVTASSRPPRALAVGRSTEHREAMLTPAKHSHDILHYAHGLEGDALREQLLAADVGLVALPEPGAGFPPQALLHLAAGHLLIAEPFAPTCGLEPGIDYLEAPSPELIVTLLAQLRLRPDAYERVRVRGRLKAEDHRASRVWPRIVRDLLQDLSSFGNTLEA